MIRGVPAIVVIRPKVAFEDRRGQAPVEGSEQVERFVVVNRTTRLNVCAIPS